jgi:Fe-S-cluster-containing dehydrogenase component
MKAAPPVTKVSTSSRMNLQEALSAHGLCLSCSGQPCLIACPVGQAHRYTPEHAAFHMTAFAGRH